MSFKRSKKGMMTILTTSLLLSQGCDQFKSKKDDQGAGPKPDQAAATELSLQLWLDEPLKICHPKAIFTRDGESFWSAQTLAGVDAEHLNALGLTNSQDLETLYFKDGKLIVGPADVRRRDDTNSIQVDGKSYAATMQSDGHCAVSVDGEEVAKVKLIQKKGLAYVANDAEQAVVDLPLHGYLNASTLAPESEEAPSLAEISMPRARGYLRDYLSALEERLAPSLAEKYDVTPSTVKSVFPIEVLQYPYLNDSDSETILSFAQFKLPNQKGGHDALFAYGSDKLVGPLNTIKSFSENPWGEFKLTYRLSSLNATHTLSQKDDAGQFGIGEYVLELAISLEPTLDKSLKPTVKTAALNVTKNLAEVPSYLSCIESLLSFSAWYDRSEVEFDGECGYFRFYKSGISEFYENSASVTSLSKVAKQRDRYLLRELLSYVYGESWRMFGSQMPKTEIQELLFWQEADQNKARLETALAANPAKYSDLLKLLDVGPEDMMKSAINSVIFADDFETKVLAPMEKHRVHLKRAVQHAWQDYLSNIGLGGYVFVQMSDPEFVDTEAYRSLWSITFDFGLESWYDEVTENAFRISLNDKVRAWVVSAQSGADFFDVQQRPSLRAGHPISNVMLHGLNHGWQSAQFETAEYLIDMAQYLRECTAQPVTGQKAIVVFWPCIKPEWMTAQGILDVKYGNRYQILAFNLKKSLHSLKSNDPQLAHDVAEAFFRPVWKNADEQQFFINSKSLAKGLEEVLASKDMNEQSAFAFAIRQLLNEYQ